MSEEVEFINGLMIKPPREGAPDFVKCQISIKREDLINWLQQKDTDWININVKESRGGKWYGAVDNWKPTQQAEQPVQQAPVVDDGFDDDIPF